MKKLEEYVKKLEERIARAERLALEGAELQKAGKYAEAIGKYRESLKVRPDKRIEAHVKKLEEYVKKLEERTARAERLALEGAELQKAGKYAEAIGKYRESLKVHPDKRIEEHVKKLEEYVKKLEGQSARKERPTPMPENWKFTAYPAEVSTPADPGFAGVWRRSEGGRVADKITIVAKGDEYELTYQESEDGPVVIRGTGRVEGNTLIADSWSFLSKPRAKGLVVKMQLIGANALSYLSTNLDGSEPWRGQFQRR